MLNGDPDGAAAAPASVQTGFDTTTVSATVNPALAPAETGFGDLDGTHAPVHPAAPTVNVVDTGEAEEPNADLDARVTALLPTKSPTDWNAVTAFMGAVVSWPDPAQAGAGYVNLHYSMVDQCNPGKLVKGMGWPYTDIDTFIKRASWIAGGTASMRDVWFCTSLQSQKDVNKMGNPKAVRFAKNALAQKSIWIDLDVELGNPKKYDTVEEALKAGLAFITAVNLRDPSAIVFSGGGIHVYWISKDPLTPEQWQPYASGLKNLLLANAVKCDAGITTDIARLLRVPGTMNHKTNPPKPVRLAEMPLKLYDFTTHLDFLKQISGPVTASPAAGPQLFADGADIDSFKTPSSINLPPDDALQARISKYEDAPLLDPRPIFMQCGFFREALRTGGADYDNALWMYSVLGATFMENGNAIAHKISKGHATYTPAETDGMFDRKVDERHNRGLGYPQCSTIRGAGCKACQTCPLLGKVKSPLNIGPAVTATVNPSDAAANHVHSNPVARLLALLDQGADIGALLIAMNEAFAVTKYGGEIVIASLSGSDISFMTVDDFHKMFANLVIFKQVGTKTDATKVSPISKQVGTTTEADKVSPILKQADTKTDAIKVSRRWFEWKGRRQYLGRGVVFEPGGPLDISSDMLNLWRGFGVAPKPGDWSLMRSHIFDVVCSGKRQHFDYLIRLMAHRVQHLGEQTGVAVALLGAPGAGKGVLARMFGHFFGKHFAHITHGDQLTGRFNAALGTASTVFLDEALWAGDKKGEGVLKALITEPKFQLEAKFRDPIMVKNVLFIMVASNNEWAIPAGTGDRRWFVLDVADTYAGLGHQSYFAPLYAEIENGGAAAMLHDLLNMNLKAFDVRAIPHTAAKAKQQALSLHGTLAWLYDVLQEGSISGEQWQVGGLTIDTDLAYQWYVEFSKRQRDWKPEIKSVWSKKIQAALGPHIGLTRPTKGNTRIRSFQFAPLDDCRGQFASHLCAPELEWEGESQQAPEHLWDYDDARFGFLDDEWEPETAEDLWDYDDARFGFLDDEWEPETDPEEEAREPTG